jgi:tRNA threonylcarbamoyladenosine biosynthesis protein TsaE
MLLPAVTASAEETVRLGRHLAEALAPGAIVALYGDLGAGKTHLVKGIAQALGVPERQVRSPTFALVHEYEGVEPKGRDVLPVYHFDAYRIKNEEEFVGLGYEEYFFGGGICCVEWPERVEPLIPDDALRLRLTHQGRDRRRIEVAPDDSGGA